MKMQAGPVMSLSPSFNSYSDRKLDDSDGSCDEFRFERRRFSDKYRVLKENADEDEEEFEFAFVARDSGLLSPIPADEVFQNGKIRPFYPVFNRGLLRGREYFCNGNEKENGVRMNSVSSNGPKVRLPLRKLFTEERETAITMKSLKTDELDGVAAETYCVWQPNAAEGQCKKSSANDHSSKRWKLKGLLHDWGRRNPILEFEGCKFK